MTLAGAGVDGVTTGIKYPVTGPDSGYSGSAGQISGLSGRTQETVTEQLKAHVQVSPGFGISTQQVWEFLRAGISLPLAIIESIIQHILPFGLGEFIDLDHAFDTLEGAFDNVFTFLGNINPLDPSFNLAAAAESFINLVLSPVNLLAELVGGFIPGFQIPGLDASKIISGLFDMSMINGLLDFLDDVPIIGDLVHAITGLTGGGIPDIGSFFSNITGFLGGVVGDFTGTISIPDLANRFITAILNPVGFFANLVGGFIPGLQIPGLDASKIVSGFIGDGLLPIINDIWTGLTGLIPGFQVASGQVGAQVGGQTNVVANIAAAVAKLEAQLADLDPATILVEDAFEYNNALGPNSTDWDMYDFAYAGGSGALNDGQTAADGHQIVWLEGGGGFNHGKRFKFKGTNAASTNDNMTVKMVLGSPISNTGAGCLNGLLARCKADMSEFLELRWTEGALALYWITGGGGTLINQGGGTETQIGSTIAIAQPAAGSVVSLDCGMTPGRGSRYYVATINGQQYVFDDVTSISAVSSAHRHRGFMMCAGRTVFFFVFFQKACGAVAHWASQNAA